MDQFQRLKEQVTSKIQEAERMATWIEANPEHDERELAIVRFLICADEANAVINQAKELLSEDEVFALQMDVEDEYPGAWEKYEQNVRRFKEAFGRELWEQDDTGEG